MAKLNIVIIDNDKVFLEKISGYLVNKTDKFVVSYFTQWNRVESLVNITKQHILLYSEDFKTQVEDFSTDTVKILMCEDEQVNDRSVKKYQKLDVFVKNILEIYFNVTGDSSYILSEKTKRKIVSVYSPIGGSGKTTLSIILAKALAKSGYKTLYINFERVCSVYNVFNNGENDGMSEVFFWTKKGKKNVPGKIISNSIQEQHTGIYYINPAESCTEYAQLTDEEFELIVDSVERLDEFDFVVVDFLGEFNKRVLNVLKRSLRVVFPYLNESLALVKLNLFVEEMSRLQLEDEILSHTVFVENKYSAGHSVAVDGCVTVEYDERLSDIDYILNNGRVGIDIVEPIIRGL